MSVTGALIRAYRKENDLTQNAFVAALSVYNPSLKKLNTVTLSRWETGMTSPSVEKKRLLLKFLSKDEDLAKSTGLYPMLRERYKKLSDATTSVLPGPNASLVGNLPAFDEKLDALCSLRDCEDQERLLDHIVDIERSTQPPGYYQLSQTLMAEYLQVPSTFAMVCVRNKHYLGHFVMLKIKPETAVAIAHNERSKYDLRAEELCSNEEKGSYVIQAVYATNPQYAMRLKTEAYLFLLEHMAHTQDLLIFSTRTDGEILRKNFGIAQVASGKNEQHGYKWFGMLSPVEDILFSETVIKLIF